MRIIKIMIKFTHFTPTTLENIGKLTRFQTFPDGTTREQYAKVN